MQVLTKNHAAGCAITCKDGSEGTYDQCIIAAHATDALKILAKQATYDELRILGAFQYAYRFQLSASCQHPFLILFCLKSYYYCIKG